MKLGLLLTVLMVFTASTARAELDPYQCSNAAIRAAIAVAKDYTEGAKITYDSITRITPSKLRPLTIYEINLSQWLDEDSFSLTYEVVVRGKQPKCKAVRVTLTGEE